MKIEWMNKKTCDMNYVQELLKMSFESGQVTNGGPLTKGLEELLFNTLRIDEGKVVIMCNNGTSALHALVSGIQLYDGKKYQWGTQDFTFPSSCEGPLSDAIICDMDGVLPIVDERCEAMVVTNLFGNVVDLDLYENLDIPVIYDNATVPYTWYKGKSALNYGVGCIVSLHHTKPIGFGEGGFIVVDKKYEECIRNICNFGICGGKYDEKILRQGNNYKISDVSSAFIFQHIEGKFYDILDHHWKLYEYFQSKLENSSFSLLENYSEGTPFVSCFCVVSSKPIDDKKFLDNDIYCRKYYTPLSGKSGAKNLWENSVCFPCHSGMEKSDIDLIVDVLEK